MLTAKAFATTTFDLVIFLMLTIGSANNDESACRFMFNDSSDVESLPAPPTP